MRTLRKPRPLSAACLFALLSITSSPAGAEEAEAAPSLDLPHEEAPKHPYIPVSREQQARSRATNFTRGTFTAVQVNVDALGQNIVGDAANEPSIGVDPTNPDRMVIGWRQFDTIASDFRQAGYGYTTDGGATWTFPGVIEPGIFRSDPVLGADSEGTIHYNSLTIENVSDYVCDVFRAPTGGFAWDGGVRAQGGDKQWMVVDATGSVGDGHIYAYWTAFFSSCPPGFFTRSPNYGDSYEPCISVPGSPQWGSLTVAPNGVLYVFGATGLTFTMARSSNARFSLGPAIAWDLSTTVSLGGTIDDRVGPNPGGLLGQAWIVADPGPVGPQGPTLYALCSVNPPGADPLDVHFVRSTDSGVTWSTPVRVNDDASTSAYQWFGTMSVAPSGRLDVVWLDTRDNPGSVNSSLYYSYSVDGGLTWAANERLSDAFNPLIGWPQQNKMGDYFHMVSDDLGFRLAWAATFNGEQDVYFGRKLVPAVAVDENLGPRPGVLLACDPNPFDSGTTIRYEVPRDSHVTLKVYDALGRWVTTLVDADRAAGTYSARFDGENLASGMYFTHLSAGGVSATEKVLRVN
ncbi:MAG: T9SS type A sorting domain-containing protein [bacterium]